MHRESCLCVKRKLFSSTNLLNVVDKVVLANLFGLKNHILFRLLLIGYFVLFLADNKSSL